MNYPEIFKEKMVLRMSGPGRISANALSEEVGVASGIVVEVASRGG